MPAIPKYPKYKNSGVEWLGDVPEHWELLPFLALFQISDEKNGKSIVGNMLSISGYRGVEEKRYESESQKRSGDQLGDYRVVRKGQLAVNTMWLNYAGLGVSDFEGHMSPAYRAYNISSRLRGRFAHHLLRSSGYVQGYTGLMQGIRPNSLQIKSEDFKRIPVVVPPLSEQDHIVAFLDEKTAQIDTLIAKKRRQIELLDEQKAILINRAVTRGLNPNAELKDSGIEWIGRIPRGWKIVALRRVVERIEQGVSPMTVEGDVGPTDWGVLKSGCTNGGTFRQNEHKKLPARFKIDPGIVVKNGDLLVSRACGSRELVASVALVEDLRYNLILSDKNFRLVLGNAVLPRFLRHSMNSWHYRRQVEPRISGAEGLPNNIPGSRLLEIAITLPPPDEQRNIIATLDHLGSATRQISSKLESQIQTLQTLRSTLIAHGVTGKIRI